MGTIQTQGNTQGNLFASVIGREELKATIAERRERSRKHAIASRRRRADGFPASPYRIRAVHDSERRAMLQEELARERLTQEEQQTARASSLWEVARNTARRHLQASVSGRGRLIDLPRDCAEDRASDVAGDTLAELWEAATARRGRRDRRRLRELYTLLRDCGILRVVRTIAKGKVWDQFRHTARQGSESRLFQSLDGTIADGREAMLLDASPEQDPEVSGTVAWFLGQLSSEEREYVEWKSAGYTDHDYAQTMRMSHDRLLRLREGLESKFLTQYAPEAEERAWDRIDAKDEEDRQESTRMGVDGTAIAERHDSLAVLHAQGKATRAKRNAQAAERMRTMRLRRKLEANGAPQA